MNLKTIHEAPQAAENCDARGYNGREKIMRRQDVADSSEPREKSHRRRSVKPRHVHAAVRRVLRPMRMSVPARTVMRAMEWHVHTEGKMDVIAPARNESTLSENPTRKQNR